MAAQLQHQSHQRNATRFEHRARPGSVRPGHVRILRLRVSARRNEREPPMSVIEYLVSYGRAGDFGRFRPAQPLALRRGDRVIIRGEQGLEIGEVMCPATAGHGHYLSRTAVGELLRRATPADVAAAQRLAERSDEIFQYARARAAELGLPLEVIDVELALDGSQAVVYHLRREECDYRPLVSSVSKAFELLVTVQNLALPAAIDEEEAG